MDENQAESPIAGKDELRAGWRTARDPFSPLSKSARWRLVDGPVSATICALLDANWSPLQPDVWLAREEHQTASLDCAPWANTNILAFFTASLRRHLWAEASHHWLGDGLEKGSPAVGPALKCRRHLLRKQQYSRVAALDAVVCGGAVTANRFLTGAQSCPRCGAPEETALHRYYLCPGNGSIEDPEGILEKSKWI